jgi:hypothetical protein
MELFITTIHAVERRNDLEGTSKKWSIHLVSTLDHGADLTMWGDLETEDPALAAEFELRGRWTLTRAE